MEILGAGGKKTCRSFQGTLFQAEVALAQLKYPPLSARNEDRWHPVVLYVLNLSSSGPPWIFDEVLRCGTVRYKQVDVNLAETHCVD